jgi:hypothetical protein
MSTPEDPDAVRPATVATANPNDGAAADAEEPETITVAVPTSLHSARYEWTRRFVIAALLGGAIWFLIIAAGRSDVGLEQGTGDARVARLVPARDAQVQRQSEVGAVLQSGFDGTLLINGTKIPEAQLDGAIDPSTVSAEDRLKLEKYGIRPNGRNRVIYTPGPGKVFESLPTGKVVVTVQFHKDRQPSVDTGVVSWTIQVQ